MDRKRYADSPREIGWRGWREAGMRAAKRIGDNDFSLRCAGVAFYGLMSLFPALALAVTVYGLGMDASSLAVQLEAAKPFLPAEIYTTVDQRLNALVESSGAALSFGLIVALAVVLWTSSRGTSSIISVLGVAYREPDKRSFIHGFFVSVALTLGAIVFAFIAFLVVAAIPVISELIPLPQYTEIIVQVARWPVMGLFAFPAISLLYRLAPHRRDANWRWIMPGAALSTVGWLFGSLAFSIYVENFSNYDATFGSLTTAIVLMLWMYYSVMIIAFGAGLNAELELITRRDSTVGPNRPMGERGAFVADNTAARLEAQSR